MKKNIILYLALVFALVLQFNIDIFAADPDFVVGDEEFYGAIEGALNNTIFPSNYNIDDIPDAVIDSYGHYVKGSIVTFNQQYNVNWIYGNQFDGVNWDDGCQYMFVLVDKSNTSKYEYYICWSDHVSADNDWKKTIGYAGYSKNDPYNIWRGYVLGQSNASYDESLYHVTTSYAISSNVFVKTNLPIFDITNATALNNYINNGDISGADNSSSLLPKVVPMPFFDKVNGLDDTSKRQRIANGFSSNLIYRWTPGSNNDFTYQNMGYEGTLSVVVNYLSQGTLSSETVTETINYTNYEGDNPYYIFASENLNKKILTLFGVDFFGSLGGRIVKATFQIRNVDRLDHNNKSASVYYAYNFIDQTSGTNNDSNNNNDSTEESTEEITYNPNNNQSGNGDVPSNSSSSSSATANGVVVNVTQNNNNNKSSIWDNLINALSALATVFSNKIGGVFDSIADFFGHLSNITDSTGILSKLIENLSTYLVGTNSGSGSGNGSGSGSSGGLGGLAGTIESITGSINTLISGVLTPFTNAVTSLMSSVTDLLNASSTLGQYITSGFGLLGDNGYISMFAAFFQFVPTEIWTIIKLAVGSSASVLLSGSVVKLLRRY